MDFLFTCDPTCIIIDQTKDSIVYLNTQSFESWIICGQCNQCGQCIEGAINPDLRPYSERLDCPVRPCISKHSKCSLRGEYL